MGRVGVLALSSTPRVEFRTCARGWAAGAARGDAQGLGEGLLSSLYAFAQHPPQDPYAAMGFLIGAVVLTTVQTVVYSVSGGSCDLDAIPGRNYFRFATPGQPGTAP